LLLGFCSPTGRLLTDDTGARLVSRTRSTTRVLPLRRSACQSPRRRGLSDCTDRHMWGSRLGKPEWGSNLWFSNTAMALWLAASPLGTNKLQERPLTADLGHRNEGLITEEGHVTDLLTDRSCQKDREFTSDESIGRSFCYVIPSLPCIPMREPGYLDCKSSLSDPGERSASVLRVVFFSSMLRFVGSSEAIDNAGQISKTHLFVFTTDNRRTSTANKITTPSTHDDCPTEELPGTPTASRGKGNALRTVDFASRRSRRWPGKLDPGTDGSTRLYV